MGILVNVHRALHAGSVSVASMIIDIPAFEVLKVWSLEITGMASAAVAGEAHGLYLATSLGTVGTPTQLTAKPENDTQSVPSGWDFRHGFGTEPTLEFEPRITIPFQPLGGVGSWPVVAGAPLIIQNKTAAAVRAALRSRAGTSNIAINARFELGV